MTTRKAVAVTLFGLMGMSGISLAISACANSADRQLAFELQMSFDGSEVTVRPSEGTIHEVDFPLSADEPGPVFLSEHGVIGQSESGAAESYCFSVSLVDDKLVLESVRGTSWTELSYSCNGAVPCSFVITEFGVRGS